MRSRPRDEHPGPGVVSESAGDIKETPDLQGAYPRLNDGQCYIDHSPPPPPREEVAAVPTRERGAGRPTKRDRPGLERLLGRQAR
jgi:hypothetical protein